MTDAPNTQPANLLYANGIDAVTGGYAMPPISPGDFKKGLKGQLPEPDAKALSNWLSWRKRSNFSLEEGRDAKKLSDSGWGAVFPVNADPAVLEALRPLLDWRKEQAGDLYKLFADNPKGAVRPMAVDSKGTWLGRQGAENFGPVSPINVPYYLLLVGSPDQIDYRFQYQLDVQYAVGRISFDTPEEYACYAESVVEAEKRQIRRARQMAFFATANPGDAATNLSHTQLVAPLADFAAGVNLQNVAPWQVQRILAADATKQRLSALLGGAETPALLFTASHGMGFPMGNELQARRQGALLCQDWPGPSAWRQAIPEDFYFSGEDISADAGLLGMIAFFFACYGAGTPQYDDFYKIAFKDRAQIAASSFIGGLPRRLLAHPKGGALAVVGHVERAWGYSFSIDGAPSLQAFRSALQSLMSGEPIGLAFEYFNQRYAELSTALTEKIQEDDWNPVDPTDMASTWTANNDAKNYVVLGDPAVRVCVADQPTDQPGEITPITLSTPTKGAAAPATDTPVTPVTPATPVAPVTPVTPATPVAPAPAMDAAASATDAAASAASVPDVQAEWEVSAPQIARQDAAAAPVLGAAVLGAPAPASSAAASGATAPASGAASSRGVVDYGITDNLGATIQQFLQKLGGFLNATIDNVTTLKISTYVTADMNQVKVIGGQITGAELRALTVVTLDGDVSQILPVSPAGVVDTVTWSMHLEMVRQAQAGRSELLQSTVASVASLLNLGGPK